MEQWAVRLSAGLSSFLRDMLEKLSFITSCTGFYPFPWQYQSYTTLSVCVRGHVCVFFPLPFSFSCLFVFSHLFSPFLPLVFFPLFPSLELSPLLFIHIFIPYSLPITSLYILLSFPLYTCSYITNADMRTWHPASFHPTVLLFDRSRTAYRWWWAPYVVLLFTMVQWALRQIRVKISK